MSTTLVDPRTEQVREAAENVEHIFCGECHDPDGPMLCGARFDGEICPDDCGHPECPVCWELWLIHDREFHD